MKPTEITARNLAIWMCCLTDTRANVAREFDLSKTRVDHIIRGVNRALLLRATTIIDHDPATQRLRTAGAIARRPPPRLRYRDESFLQLDRR
jgi:hemin uptake protein HemP